MPGRFELTSTLAKIWHAPDHFRLLDPLPPMHRRGIIAGFLLVIIGILLPSDDSQSPASTSREAKWVKLCRRMSDKSQAKRNNRRQQVNFTLFRSSGR